MYNKGKVDTTANTIRGSSLFCTTQVIHECNSFLCLEFTCSWLFGDEKTKCSEEFLRMDQILMLFINLGI